EDGAAAPVGHLAGALVLALCALAAGRLRVRAAAGLAWPARLRVAFVGAPDTLLGLGRVPPGGTRRLLRRPRIRAASERGPGRRPARPLVAARRAVGLGTLGPCFAFRSRRALRP